MILASADLPLYVQLADLLRQRIARGVWREGDKLPSLEQLVAEFEVARVTVRQAIERLTRDGLVSPQRGRFLRARNSTNRTRASAFSGTPPTPSRKRNIWAP